MTQLFPAHLRQGSMASVFPQRRNAHKITLENTFIDLNMKVYIFLTHTHTHTHTGRPTHR